MSSSNMKSKDDNVNFTGMVMFEVKKKLNSLQGAQSIGARATGNILTEYTTNHTGIIFKTVYRPTTGTLGFVLKSYVTKRHRIQLKPFTFTLYLLVIPSQTASSPFPFQHQKDFS